MQGRKVFPKSYLYATFILQIIAWQFSIALVILLGAQGYSGLDGSTPITATCTQTYFTSKYTAIIPILQTTFLCSLIAVIGLTISFAMMVVWVVRVCSEGGPNAQAKSSTKMILYLVGNVVVLTAIPPCGYYLTQLAQLNSCTSTFNLAQLVVIFIVATLLLLSAIIYLIFIVLSIIRTPSDAIYRDVSSNPTQPQQQKYSQASPPHQSYNKPYERNVENNRSSPPRQPGAKNEGAQHTKENLFEHQDERNPRIVYNYKERDPQQLPYSNNKKSPQESEIQSRYAPPESSHYISPKKKSQAQNSRLNRRIDDDDEFQVERSRYMNKLHGGSILPSRGLQQKSPYNHKTPNHSEAYRKHKESPPQRLDREAVLISHIRGKYAN